MVFVNKVMPNGQIMKELKDIKKDISFIKKHIVDVDCILTKEDIVALKDYKEEMFQGKLVSHEDVKKELGI